MKLTKTMFAGRLLVGMAQDAIYKHFMYGLSVGLTQSHLLSTNHQPLSGRLVWLVDQVGYLFEENRQVKLQIGRSL
jgi:hypothetical protein